MACCTPVFHELVGKGNGYAVEGSGIGVHATRPTTCFETFPFPEPTEEQREAIGEAARELNQLRENWLNPPGLGAAELKKRTLTNLYNNRPHLAGQRSQDAGRGSSRRLRLAGGFGGAGYFGAVVDA